MYIRKASLILAIAWIACPFMRAAVVSLEAFAPAPWSGMARTRVDPAVIGISNAADAAGFAFSPAGSKSFLDGALLLRTNDLRPYVHNAKTCRLVSDAAEFTGMTTLAANNAYFPAYTTKAPNGNQVATQFVAWRLSDGSIVIDSRHLADDYPVVPNAVDAVTVELWAVSQVHLNALLKASLAAWLSLGSVSFVNTGTPRSPTVMVQQASYFPGQLKLRVMNYSDQSETVTILVERFLNGSQQPVVVARQLDVPPAGSTVQLSVDSFNGAVVYVQDAAGSRDQAYLGRSFQFFSDSETGGQSKVSFSLGGCSSGGTPTQDAMLLVPNCSRLSGVVQQYSGIYLPVGSYVGEVVDLKTLGASGFEFWANSTTPFRVQLEDIDVSDFDFHGVNLPATNGWTKFRVAFSNLRQRGFGQPLSFTGQILQVTWLVPVAASAPTSQPKPFSIAVDNVAVVYPRP